MHAQFQIWAAPSLPGIVVLVGMVGIWMLFDGRRRLGWLLVGVALVASGIIAIEEIRGARGAPPPAASAHALEVTEARRPPGLAAPRAVESSETEKSQEPPPLYLP